MSKERIVGVGTGGTGTVPSGQKIHHSQVEGLDGKIDAIVDPKILAETTARQSEDATLNSRVDAETSARIAADNTLTTNLQSEVVARTAAVATRRDKVVSVTGLVVRKKKADGTFYDMTRVVGGTPTFSDV
jgi:hypothetical protein